jgi:tetratricopeptide (TPR) repeat protein
LICTVPVNERDLAPIGEASLASIPAAERATVRTLLAEAEQLLDSDTDTAAAAAKLTTAAAILPEHPRVAYLRGRLATARGDDAAALAHYSRARDLDPMPWRATSQANAVVRAIGDAHALVGAGVDLEQSMRAVSPGGAIGWEMMDDHVHLSLAGQVFVARSVLDVLLTTTNGGLRDFDASRLASDAAYLARLGDNRFDRWAVAHRMRTLLQAEFFQATNPAALRRFERICQQLEAQMSPGELAAVEFWRSQVAGGLPRPITGVIGAHYADAGLAAEARAMFLIARQNVPRYLIWATQLTWRAITADAQVSGG